MPISDNIKCLRDRYGITQRDLADIAGVTDKAVSTWEIGTNEPRMGAIQKIADHFGILKSNIIEDGGMELITQQPPADVDEELLDAELTRRLCQLTPAEMEKVDAFVQGLLAAR